MKKIISYICVICIMLSCFTFAFVSADDIVSKLIVSTATAKAGNEVEVTLSSASSAFLSGLELNIKYESNAMELVSVDSAENGVFPSDTFQGSETLTANPYYLSWDNSLSDAVIANGDLAVLKFKIKTDAYNGEYAVMPVFSSGGAFDGELNDVDFSVESGCITVTDGIVPESPITTSTTTTTATTTTTSTSTTTTTTTLASTSTTITEPTENSELSVELSMNGGASIRLNEKTGIRFYTTIDKEKIDEFRAKGYKVEMGTLISPIDYIKNTELNFDLPIGRYIDVKYTSLNYFTDQTGFSGIVGSIVNIKESTSANNSIGNIARSFVGRGYVKVTDNSGNEKISYADYSKENARSLGYVAYLLKNDEEAGAKDLYSSNKELIDNWADIYKKIKDPSANDNF